MPRILLKRVYEPALPADGVRVLVERLWPRGITKERAAVQLWLKDISPSPALRSWYQHDPEKWPEFRRRYLKELKDNPEAVAELRKLVEKGRATFVYAARDEERNSARVLKEFLETTP